MAISLTYSIVELQFWLLVSISASKIPQSPKHWFFIVYPNSFQVCCADENINIININ